MSLIKGQVSVGSFSAPGIKVGGIEIEGSRNAIIGIRPEDCNVGARRRFAGRGLLRRNDRRYHVLDRQDG